MREMGRAALPIIGKTLWAGDRQEKGREGRKEMDKKEVIKRQWVKRTKEKGKRKKERGNKQSEWVRGMKEGRMLSDMNRVTNGC